MRQRNFIQMKSNNKVRKFICVIANVMLSLRQHWRRYGSLYCVILMLSTSWYSAKIVGGLMIIMMTVPCGIKSINTNKYLWYGRQLLFAGIGILNLMA